MIAKLDERIAGLGGKRRGRPPKETPAIAAPPSSKRMPRRRRRIVHAPGQTLRDMVVKVLTRASAPVKVGVFVELVKKAGYETSAKTSTLLTSIYHVLADEKVFRRMGTGIYALKAMPRAAATGKRRRATPKVVKSKREKKGAAEQAPVAAPQTPAAAAKA